MLLLYLLWHDGGCVRHPLNVVVPEKASEPNILSSDVDRLSSDAILALMKTAPRLHPDSVVFKLTSTDTMIKFSQDADKSAIDATEANALDLLFAKATIPAPPVRRVLMGERHILIVGMDYIKGQTLADATDTSILFRCGPFFFWHSELSAFCNERRWMVLDAQGAPADHPSRKELFDDSHPLVLAHQDLNLRNFILGEDGRLWIIGWAWSGYYSPWFEYVTMQIQAKGKWISGADGEFWKTLVPFICGPYFTQEKWPWKMRQGLNFA
ncbi:hypothetical protein EDD16DRAFT_1694470 [Pisolithus croceorrhizus]|nr:hypothetical protein EDD16DRAFT_1694470 [Pisolithus croceorrhizus]